MINLMIYFRNAATTYIINLEKTENKVFSAC